MTDWNLIDLAFTDKVHDALLQQHHAAQYLTMLAKAFVEEKPDDSHTNLGYLREHQALVSRLIPGGEYPFMLALRLTDLSLIFLTDKNNIIGEITLDGKTKGEVLTELKNQVHSFGLDDEKITSTLHYELPDHRLDHSSLFDSNDRSSFFENNKYRSNAHIILQATAEKLLNHGASGIRTWPHHFDSGGLIPVEYNNANELIRSIGIGFAIPDTLVDEPYFYLSYWSADPNNLLGDPDAFSGKGSWMLPEWQGATLPLSALLSHKNAKVQQLEAMNFFDEGIAAILRFTGKKDHGTG